METQNLWPDFAIEATRSPKSILKEQAGYLMEKTNNVLSADVETRHYKGRISHGFYVVAPAMDNYRYKLFSVSHSVVSYYPLAITTEVVIQVGEEEDNVEIFDNSNKANNEDEFLIALSSLFKAPENIRIISSLLSQSLTE